MFHIAQRDSSAGALCCREKYYSATSSIVLGKYGIKYKCYPLISEKVKFKQNTISFFVFLCQTMIKDYHFWLRQELRKSLCVCVCVCLSVCAFVIFVNSSYILRS